MRHHSPLVAEKRESTAQQDEGRLAVLAQVAAAVLGDPVDRHLDPPDGAEGLYRRQRIVDEPGVGVVPVDESGGWRRR